ncbi:MAG: crossover junction endodeoxyribonuclease RuvC [Phycisphaerae bacterium]
MESRQHIKAAARILGVDPGLRRTGYCVLELTDARPAGTLIEAGIIRLDAKVEMPHRLVELQREIADIITRLCPITLACEELYAHYKHPRTAILMGHARGVILAAAGIARLDIVAVPSTHAKKLLTGNGHASKNQIQRAISAMLGLAALPEPNDIADAIAIALAGHRLMHREAVSCAETSV